MWHSFPLMENLHFYFSPIYSHPDLFKKINPNLKRFLKGKSHFNINKITLEILEELEEILKKGINKYKQIEWI